jgi:two-component system, cell cycle sensor histidine kinase and response regulator CckA
MADDADQIHLLVIEDSEDDADLLVRELERGGYRLQYRRVDTPEDLRAALADRDWDLVIADYTMPRFSGAEALSMVRGRSREVPFIFVSGTIGEEAAIAALKAGAQDYILKGKTGRLVPAIERELREARARRERDRLEAERRAMEDRYRQVLTIAGDGIVVVDDEFRIAIFNRGAERMFGFAAEKVIARPLDILWPPRLADTNHRRIAEMLLSPEAAALASGGEFLALRADGEEFPVEATLSQLVETGKTIVTLIVRDIAERKRSEEKLRQLSRAVEQSANLIIITDTEGTIEYVNPRLLEATGYRREEVIGRKPFFWRAGRSEAAIDDEVWRTALSGQDWRGEFQNMRKDGGEIVVSVTVSPVTNDNGAITHVIAIEEDITRRREIEAQLHQAQKLEALGMLTGGIAHDFNNLLAVIIGNLDLITPRLKGDEATHTGAKLALAAALRSAELTRQLLAFARRQPLSPRPLNLNQLVSGTVAMLQRALGNRIEFRTELSPSLWPAEADSSQVETALANLAINARDAMPDGGVLTIATRNQHLEGSGSGADALVAGDYVALSVTDTGVGIPPGELKRVLEPFYTTKAPGKGTGLGLSMVYGFAKQSRGHLELESVVGHGTSVTLYLPRTENVMVEETPGEEATGRAVQETTVLVVEDNPHVQDVVVRQLSELGYNVHAVDDALAALSVLRQELAIDLLFSDISLPGGISGTALAREAKKLRPGLRVLLTSGLAVAADGTDGDRDGVAFIGKPYRRKELASKVDAVLRQAG